MSYSSEVLADSPVGYWRLGEPSGTTAASQVNTPDADLQYRNTPTLGATGALTASGDTDTAAGFTRANSEDVYGGHIGELDVSDVMTVEAWVKRASTGGYHYIFTQGSLCVALRIDDSTNALHVDQAGAAPIVSSTVAISDTTTWHHCVYTKNGSTNKLYIDGEDVTGSVSNQTMNANAQFNVIASDGNSGNYFDGYIDEVALYPTALNQTRIQAHFNAAQAASPNTKLGSAIAGA